MKKKGRFSVQDGPSVKLQRKQQQQQCQQHMQKQQQQKQCWSQISVLDIVPSVMYPGQREGARDSAGYPDLKRPQAKSFKTLTLSETGLQPTALTPHAHFTDTHNTAVLYKTLQLGLRVCTDEHLPDTLLVGPGEKMKAGWDKSGVGMSVSLTPFPVLKLGCLQSVFYVHVCQCACLSSCFHGLPGCRGCCGLQGCPQACFPAPPPCLIPVV